MTECLGVSRDDILKAGGLLRLGKLVALPTETVYGLAADATNDAAVARIFAAKARPSFNPFRDSTDVSPFRRQLAMLRAHWRGRL